MWGGGGGGGRPIPYAYQKVDFKALIAYNIILSKREKAIHDCCIICRKDRQSQDLEQFHRQFLMASQL